MAESYTGTCALFTSTIQSCASRADSLRTECTKSYTALTEWPGPCECSYYAQDLMCFDEQALCAEQAWTQIPQWFRDGVTSCLMKDADYTVRAQLGTFSNPFTITSIAGVLVDSSQSAVPSRTGSSGATITISSSNTQPSDGTTTSTALPEGDTSHLSGRAIAGIVIGSIAALSAALLVFLLYRRRERRKVEAKATAQEGFSKPELPGDSKMEHSSWPAKSELSGSEVVCELSGRERCELESPLVRHEMLGDVPDSGSTQKQT